MFAIVLVATLLAVTVLVARRSTSAAGRPTWSPSSVVAFAIAEGPGTGTRYGFAAGLLRDLLSGTAHVVGEQRARAAAGRDALRPGAAVPLGGAAGGAG